MDIRWQQRFLNYQKALAKLSAAVDLSRERSLSELEVQGLIQSFEYTYELAWNTQKDFLIYQGVSDLSGARDTIREAFSLGIIEDGEVWMQMLKDRNLSVHTYNEDTANRIAEAICEEYHPAFNKLNEQFLTRVEAL